MKILLISEDLSILDENSRSRAKVLEYASLSDMLFVIVASKSNTASKGVIQAAPNAWIYQTSSSNKFVQAYKVKNLASFEVSAQGIFRADIIVCEDQFTSMLAGYLLTQKFKKPLYINMSIVNNKLLFSSDGFMGYVYSKISWHILNKADYIKVDNTKLNDILLKKNPYLKVGIIKPFVDYLSLVSSSQADLNEERVSKNLIRKKFIQFRFTVLTFVDNIDQIKFAIKILKKINEHFPPISLIVITSDNVSNVYEKYIASENLQPWVCLENVNEDLNKYLVSSNIFIGLSSGEKYQEIFLRACALGASIIALQSDISKLLIEEGKTGFLCPSTEEDEVFKYVVSKIFFLMNNPVTSLNFKINLPPSVDRQFGETKEEYNSNIQSSWQKSIDNYKSSHLKIYKY